MKLLSTLLLLALTIQLSGQVITKDFDGVELELTNYSAKINLGYDSIELPEGKNDLLELLSALQKFEEWSRIAKQEGIVGVEKEIARIGETAAILQSRRHNSNFLKCTFRVDGQKHSRLEIRVITLWEGKTLGPNFSVLFFSEKQVVALRAALKAIPELRSELNKAALLK